MAIRYEPEKILKKMAGKRKVESLVTEKLTLNRAVLSSLNEVGILSKRELEYVGLNVIRQYRDKAETLTEEGLTKAEAREEVLENKALLLQRVQNATIYSVTEAIKEKYFGEFYIWLPSTAENPDHKHERKYGKRYQIGKGEMPGDRYGCKCGMEILVDEKRLKL